MARRASIEWMTVCVGVVGEGKFVKKSFSKRYTYYYWLVDQPLVEYYKGRKCIIISLGDLWDAPANQWSCFSGGFKFLLLIFLLFFGFYVLIPKNLLKAMKIYYGCMRKLWTSPFPPISGIVCEYVCARLCEGGGFVRTNFVVIIIIGWWLDCWLIL